MTVVVAAPESLSEFALALHDGASRLRSSARSLENALFALFATRPDFGPLSSHAPGAIQEEAGVLDMLSRDLTRFVAALRAADAAGIGVRLTGARPIIAADVVIVDEEVLRNYGPIDASTTVVELMVRLRRQQHEHAALPEAAPRLGSRYFRWRLESVRLQTELRQLEVGLTPPHSRWGGVDQLAWASAAQYLDARNEARGEQALTSIVGPFSAAALATGAVLSLNHGAVLKRLDQLAKMPLVDFLSARSTADADDPWFDWTSDGCSGPIPPGAANACLRHDFLYRNARMIRDQWGLAPRFADNLKRSADAAFAQELEDSYDGWATVVAPPLGVWINAAELAVTVFGEVDEPWSPPAADRFYGSEQPAK